jgi:hypothetical protein
MNDNYIMLLGGSKQPFTSQYTSSRLYDTIIMIKLGGVLCARKGKMLNL